MWCVLTNSINLKHVNQTKEIDFTPVEKAKNIKLDADSFTDVVFDFRDNNFLDVSIDEEKL